VGLRPALPALLDADASPTTVPAVLQSPPTPWSSQRSATHQQTPAGL
jgi:hypothetical protein